MVAAVGVGVAAAALPFLTVSEGSTWQAVVTCVRDFITIVSFRACVGS